MISISIVLYKNKLSEIKNKVSYLCGSELISNIFLVDNSEDPTVTSKDFTCFDKVSVFSGHGNIGYGRGHNLAFFSTKLKTKYHLIVNLDVEFDIVILNEIVKYMDNNSDVVQLMPKVLNPDMTIQRVCKKLPSPYNLIFRRFFSKSKRFHLINDDYEIKSYDYSYILDSPYLSGCFMFCRSSSFSSIGGFDERYFMYPEDIDLTRRMYKIGRTVCYPHVHVIHEHGKASFKSKKMAYIHSVNMIKYFNKWGWLVDSERAEFNSKVDEFIENNK